MSKPKKQQRKSRYRTLIMWGSVAVVAVAVVGAAWFGFGGSGKKASTAPVRQAPVVSSEKLVSVEVVDKDYNPRMLTVTKGTTVVWKFAGELPHNVAEDRGAFTSDTQTDGEYSRTFDTAGTFYYYCTLHHGMQGTLVVTE